MSESEDSGSSAPASPGVDGSQTVTVFECDHCGAKRFQRIIPYDRFGFPICPVCNRTKRPESIAIR